MSNPYASRLSAARDAIVTLTRERDAAQARIAELEERERRYALSSEILDAESARDRWRDRAEAAEAEVKRLRSLVDRIVEAAEDAQNCPEVSMDDLHRVLVRGKSDT